MKRLIIGVFAVCALTSLVMAGTRLRQKIQDKDQIKDPAVCLVCSFVDEDGDGYCDNCGACVPQVKGEDADGDGIPNGQDDDYTPPQDGSGRK